MIKIVSDSFTLETESVDMAINALETLRGKKQEVKAITKTKIYKKKGFVRKQWTETEERHLAKRMKTDSVKDVKYDPFLRKRHNANAIECRYSLRKKYAKVKVVNKTPKVKKVSVKIDGLSLAKLAEQGDQSRLLGNLA